MNKQYIKAQDVKVGDVIAFAPDLSFEVGKIVEFKTPDGKRAFNYYLRESRNWVWNRQDEELIKLN